MRTREEHLEWCKARARVYLDDFDLGNAWASFVSDMNTHAETRIPTKGALADLTLLCMLKVTEGDHDFVRRYIEGFR